MSLDHANKANAEEQKQLKRYAGVLMEVETTAQEEMRMRSDIEDQAGIAERKSNALSGELEEARMLLDTAEKCKKAVSDASRLAEELRTEQEHSQSLERGAKSTFAQRNELQQRLEDAEATAASYGRKMIAKLEEKVRMLESELATCQVRSSETHKGAIRADRKIKELQFTSEEEQKNFERLNELV